MAEQKVKTLNNQLISWLAFRAEKEAEIEELKQEEVKPLPMGNKW